MFNFGKKKAVQEHMPYITRVSETEVFKTLEWMVEENLCTTEHMYNMVCCLEKHHLMYKVAQDEVRRIAHKPVGSPNRYYPAEFIAMRNVSELPKKKYLEILRRFYLS